MIRLRIYDGRISETWKSTQGKLIYCSARARLRTSTPVWVWPIGPYKAKVGLNEDGLSKTATKGAFGPPG